MARALSDWPIKSAPPSSLSFYYYYHYYYYYYTDFFFVHLQFSTFNYPLHIITPQRHNQKKHGQFSRRIISVDLFLEIGKGAVLAATNGSVGWAWSGP